MQHSDFIFTLIGKEKTLHKKLFMVQLRNLEDGLDIR